MFLFDHSSIHPSVVKSNSYQQYRPKCPSIVDVAMAIDGETTARKKNIKDTERSRASKNRKKNVKMIKNLGRGDRGRIESAENANQYYQKALDRP